MAESWDQAVYRCAKMCGRLFMPKNPTDDHVLGTILNREASTIGLSSNKRVWLGAYSKNGSAPVWSDSTLMERPTLAFTSSRLGCSALTAYVEPYRRTEDFVAGNYSCIGPVTGHNFVCMRSSSYSVPKECLVDSCPIDGVQTQAYAYYDPFSNNATVECKRGHIFPDGTKTKVLTCDKGNFLETLPPCILIDEYLASLPPNWSEGKHITAATLVEPGPRVPASGTPYQPPVIGRSSFFTVFKWHITSK
ncbi:uncharacterized protein LOC106174171 [Lingula anatina]|uniref:Uncharacterized protein LOC106174171 n=1 Tax=Lingula anatina TaxID=7574 RepID=A0A1S3JKZ6_LINAN|nr:uncharacterized protein LOC106174171 [Lingula anatina]|eukprot:XP_013411047.1 uncharacterized protein LOC106174171 [Lingula anatina]